MRAYIKTYEVHVLRNQGGPGVFEESER
jgi:hypothetical protein